MADPSSSIATGVMTGAGISLGGGMLMGAQVDALMAGLLAAIFVSIWLQSIDSRAKAASAVGLA